MTFLYRLFPFVLRFFSFPRMFFCSVFVTKNNNNIVVSTIDETQLENVLRSEWELKKKEEHHEVKGLERVIAASLYNSLMHTILIGQKPPVSTNDSLKWENFDESTRISTRAIHFLLTRLPVTFWRCHSTFTNETWNVDQWIAYSTTKQQTKRIN